MQVHWRASAAVSCYHAAEALMRELPLADEALTAALAGPAGALRQTLQDEDISIEQFMGHVVPWAAESDNTLELARVALIKTIGRARAEPRVGQYQALLADVKTAFRTALPIPKGVGPPNDAKGSDPFWDLEETLAAGIGPLQLRWNAQGLGLLGGIVRWTEPEILVEEALVMLVHPALGGGGAAHLPYNSVRIESVPVDSVAELPEAVRLSWLLGMLNLDLPRYSEVIRPQHLNTVAGLALLPIALAAAEPLELARCDEASIRLAMQEWLRAGEKTEDWVGTVSVWWQTYRETRPEWITALQGLDRALDQGSVA
jgi:hypothetical protein